MRCRPRSLGCTHTSSILCWVLSHIAHYSVDLKFPQAATVEYIIDLGSEAAQGAHKCKSEISGSLNRE